MSCSSTDSNSSSRIQRSTLSTASELLVVSSWISRSSSRPPTEELDVCSDAAKTRPSNHRSLLSTFLSLCRLSLTCTPKQKPPSNTVRKSRARFQSLILRPLPVYINHRFFRLTTNRIHPSQHDHQNDVSEFESISADHPTYQASQERRRSPRPRHHRDSLSFRIEALYTERGARKDGARHRHGRHVRRRKGGRPAL